MCPCLSYHGCCSEPQTGGCDLFCGRIGNNNTVVGLCITHENRGLPWLQVHWLLWDPDISLVPFAVSLCLHASHWHRDLCERSAGQSGRIDKRWKQNGTERNNIQLSNMNNTTITKLRHLNTYIGHGIFSVVSALQWRGTTVQLSQQPLLLDLSLLRLSSILIRCVSRVLSQRRYNHLAFCENLVTSSSYDFFHALFHQDSQSQKRRLIKALEVTRPVIYCLFIEIWCIAVQGFEQVWVW